MSKLIRIMIVLLSITILNSSCQSNSNKENHNLLELERYSNATSDTLSLNKKLIEKRLAFEATASSEKQDLYNKGIQAIINDSILHYALNKGDKAVDFTLKNALGEKESLNTFLENGPVILTWYRGGWCPYCNITLSYLQSNLSEFKSLGATLLALTPELPDSSLSTKEKLSLDFEVLSDLNNQVAKEYGITFKLIDPVAKSYQNSFDLHAFNCDSSNVLPIAATYIIDKDKIIKYAFLNADYRVRAEPSELLKVLKQMKQDF